MKFQHGNFDDDQLNLLRKAFDDVCSELGIEPTDEISREQIAHSLIVSAKSGEYDPERLRECALSRFGAPGST